MERDPYRALFQINTRVRLTELSRSLGRRATLDDIPDSELDHLARMGFDWVWFLSVWQTGLAGQRISRSNPEWRKEFKKPCPISGMRTLAVRVSPSRGTGFMTSWEVTPPSSACAIGFKNADCG